MLREQKPATTQPTLRRRLSHIYALLIGLFGVIVLVQLVEHQTAPFDLLALLSFTLLALIVSYFRIPVGRDSAEFVLDGAILLGATLTGGPVIGGWAAFITGLITSFVPLPTRQAVPPPWIDSVSSATLHGGRNVIAVSGAWIVYYNLGGTLKPLTLTPLTALALLVMCLTYALIRTLTTWPSTLLQSLTPRQTFSKLLNAHALLVDLIPLPVALLISPAFVQFDWTRFLILSLVLIGMGAAMHQMVKTIHTLQVQMATLQFTDQVRQAITDAPQNLHALCSVAHQFCAEIVSVKCEIGLYNDTMSHVHIFISSDGHTVLPSMRIPLIPLWEWISTCPKATLIEASAQAGNSPSSLPPLGLDQASQTILVVPIKNRLRPVPTQQNSVLPEQSAPPEPSSTSEQRSLGALLLHSERPGMFDLQATERLSILADQIGEALPRLQSLSPIATQAIDSQIARQIQLDLIATDISPLQGWDMAIVWQPASQDNSVWYCGHVLADGSWQLIVADAVEQGLSAALTNTITRAMIQTQDLLNERLSAQALQEVNAYLLATNRQVALLSILIDQENILSWINAGCPALIWWHNDQARAEILETAGPVLGMAAMPAYDQTNIAVEPGDVLLACTNGLINASWQGQAYDGTEFRLGIQRLAQALQKLVNCSASEIAQGVIHEVTEQSSVGPGRISDSSVAFTGSAPLSQDTLLVVLRRMGK